MTPQRTYAIVVGIEQYEAADALIGPALDAARFVVWLRKNQVPAQNIRLFLSPLQESQPQVLALLQDPEVGVNWAPAASQEIAACLERLGDREQYDGDLLYLFWGGHGIADASGNRHLLYSDTTETTLHKHLDLPSWLARLRSYGNLPVQIGYLDACAISRPRWDLGSNKVQAGPPRALQSVFFAASIGERAGNNDITHSGHFSTALREIIGQVQATNPNWPPDPRRVIDLLQERFRTTRTQKPVYYDAGDLEGNRFEGGGLPESGFVSFVSWRTGYLVAELKAWGEAVAAELPEPEVRADALRLVETEASLSKEALGKPLADPCADWTRTLAAAIHCQKLDALLTLIERRKVYLQPLTDDIRARRNILELATLIEESPIEERDLQDAFQHTAAALGIRTSPRSRRQMLDKLRPSAIDPCGPAAELALRVNAICSDPRLLSWVISNIKPQTRQAIETKLQEERSDPSHHLFFWITQKQLTAEWYRGKNFEFLKAWPPVPFNETEAAGLIDRYLGEVERHSQNLFLHFMLSPEYFSWSAQALLVSGPGGGHVPLGSAYPTLTRWRERVRREPRTGHRDWVDRAPRILGPRDCVSLSCGWIAENTDASEFEKVLSATGIRHQLITFDFAVSRNTAMSPKRLIAALCRGMPLMLWPCAEPPDRTTIRRTLEDYARSGGFEWLRKEMRQLYDDEERRLWQVTLFWDDPAQQPLKFHYQEMEHPP